MGVSRGKPVVVSDSPSSSIVFVVDRAVDTVLTRPNPRANTIYLAAIIPAVGTVGLRLVSTEWFVAASPRSGEDLEHVG